MAQIDALSGQERTAFERDIQIATRGQTTVEAAAQRLSELFRTRFSDEVALARVFLTLPLAGLPATNRGFVEALATKTGIISRLREDTLVLSLVGTSGIDPDWNDRRKSQGHVGIPLATADFVDAIPMVSRLLKELGVGLDWIDAGDTGIVARTLGSSTGVFFVDDARSQKDNQGRLIIPGQDFVAKYNVQTVFGLGGGYIGTTACVVTIVFCRTALKRDSVVALMGLMNRFKASTLDLVKAGKIFAA